MKKLKILIGILLLFMVIGFATVTVSLRIIGNAKILSDINDFKVYFSDVKVNGVQNLSLVESEKELNFDFSFNIIGTTQVISYDVTNASKIFDASLNISCTQGDEYFSVVNVFDTTNLEALGTRTGTLTMKKLKSISSDSDKDYSVTCTIDATPIERDSEAGGSVISPVQPIQLYTGDVISIDGEKFNVISQTDTTVTMLAQYVIGENNRQDSYCGDEEYQDYYINTGSAVEFSGHDGWTYVEGMKDLDIQAYDIPVKSVVNNYTSYLQIVTGDTNVVGNLVTLAELKELGCTIQDDYSEAGTCSNSPYASWLVNKQDWWTRSVITSIPDYIWFVRPNGDFFTDYDRFIGVRPIITISKETLKKS